MPFGTTKNTSFWKVSNISIGLNTRGGQVLLAHIIYCINKVSPKPDATLNY